MTTIRDFGPKGVPTDYALRWGNEIKRGGFRGPQYMPQARLSMALWIDVIIEMNGKGNFGTIGVGKKADLVMVGGNPYVVDKISQKSIK